MAQIENNILVKNTLQLSFFACSYSYIADIASFIDHFIFNRLANCATFFVYMQAIGIETFTKIWAKLDEAPRKVFWGNIHGG